MNGLETRPRVQLTIERMLRGGYLVMDNAWSQVGGTSQLLFCSSTIDEALAFIKSELTPPLMSQGNLTPEELEEALKKGPGVMTWVKS